MLARWKYETQAMGGERGLRQEIADPKKLIDELEEKIAKLQADIDHWEMRNCKLQLEIDESKADLDKALKGLLECQENFRYFNVNLNKRNSLLKILKISFIRGMSSSFINRKLIEERSETREEKAIHRKQRTKLERRGRNCGKIESRSSKLPN